MKPFSGMSLGKVARGAGYGLFAITALLVSLYLTFPAEAVGQRLAHEVRMRSGGAYTLRFKELSPWRLTGFAAEAVSLRVNRSPQPPLDIAVDDLKARLRILPLLLARLSASAKVDLGQGSVDVVVTPRGPGAVDADLSIDDLNLSSPPLIPKLVGLTLGGKLDGSATAEWRPDPKASTGKGAFTLANATVGPGTIQGFTLPATELGTIKPELVIDGGRLRIASFKQEGGQIQLKVSGGVQLRPQFEQSQLDLCLMVKADPNYLRKNPNMESALQLAEVRFRRDPQGFLNIPLGGTVAEPVPRQGLCTGSSR
jgi:type II secretion system protein N